LTNLIFNAVDALPEGGKIILRTSAVGERTVLEVADNGIGMTEEVRLKCFEPFFSTKGEQGSGLGLSVVYGSIRRHGGLVELESAVGRGTTFRISLPIYRRANATAGPRDGPIRSRRVLLVEDEARVRDIVLRYLVADGNQVEEAVDGADGLAKFAPDRFDLVMTDRGMPGLDGDRLAAAIKARAPTMPVVMLTGYGDLMNAASERPPGVDLILSKPITLQRLRAALAQVVATGNEMRDRSTTKT
jgi:CheY-like chemotaxis protein